MITETGKDPPEEYVLHPFFPLFEIIFLSIHGGIIIFYREKTGENLPILLAGKLRNTHLNNIFKIKQQINFKTRTYYCAFYFRIYVQNESGGTKLNLNNDIFKWNTSRNFKHIKVFFLPL